MVLDQLDNNMINLPLVERYRPTNLNDLVLDDETRAYFQKIKKTDDLPHLLFIGPPGTGKTSLAKVLVNQLGAAYRYINASDERGIDTIREKVAGFALTKSMMGEVKIIILDESDGLTGDAQRSLRNLMEEHVENVRFILTANYRNRVSEPITSRTQVFELVPPLDDCFNRVVSVLKQECIKVPAGQRDLLKDLIKRGYPDMRRILNDIERFTDEGELNITRYVESLAFPTKVFDMIENNVSANNIRKFVIENEVEFGSDYHSLLKGLFEHIFTAVQDESKRRNCMLIVGKYMEAHQHVMDFEINAFCCVIQLLEAVNA